ncbi:Peroxyureidoacrylate/ureidoacrylate amidohydrolase RutB [Paraburkholderia nemoris]|uniref:Peroxyureidoacrylate/ureidoacrylate amidohydrolase RutB n=1 Tax=Paraburkholderia nemoris TaxID=2793076 RepID=A0ABN7L045_9BURK|nr:cysteine hydrolase [Paraburkholderia nemoris]CAE6723627.1 Peroxyureidoacrylate/ureidoacrylate amidohydrolase RutB [Paraburkholderia nemoris]CAE6749445.1 Peroxyureidoacrylate/ureidoacrylate amidohydrolase RutB [Paraburkholderia nemoris]
MTPAARTHRTAVLALHYQNDVLHAQGCIRVGLAEDDPARERVIAAAGQLIAGARQLDLPLIHIRIAFRADYADLIQNCQIFRQTAQLGAVKDGTWGAAFFSGLEPIEDREHEFVLRHHRTSGFIGTPLELLLRKLGTRHLIVAGVATHSVVEMTARHAADLGYEVTIAADACAAARAEVHKASLASMSLIAEVGSVASALASEKDSR